MHTVWNIYSRISANFHLEYLRKIQPAHTTCG
jgi:hypothetical protein